MSRTFLIVDDHALIRVGLGGTLRRAFPEARILEAADGRRLLEQLQRECGIDLVILDLCLEQGGRPDFGLLRGLCEADPGLKVLVISASEHPRHVRKALAIGARGYVPKAAPEEALLAAVEEVLAGGTCLPETGLPESGNDGALTGRQAEILQRLVEGRSNREIALELGLALSTVKAHVSAIYRQLGVENRAQLVACALSRGLVDGAPQA
ncbi:MAG: DNA-binding response regulator [Gammaproteobacteria bacterium]|nr:MAG: DNA-binding response regulator [Gammaproteobacteria bacterium]